ncbi:MAG: AmmeMemoRadiSam system protein A [Phycisphaerae bacterium]|nr:AmmeMemoRadiSam system protein A [Phycisphaerae bacterium]
MTDAERRTLLRIARDAVEAGIAGRPLLPAADVHAEAPGYGGAFVTLRTGGQLRGCIGTFSPDGPLPEMIQKIAVEAAHDPRFLAMPLRTADLPHLDIEISLLSPMCHTDDPLSLELGVHGIHVRRGHQMGCFLPQVATERPQWSKEEFLRRCCADKAHLPPDAWREPGTDVSLFTAEIFNEREMTARS